MANEIVYRDPNGTTGLNIYVQRFTPTFSVWNGTSHVAFVAANWTSYAITLVSQGGGFYAADMPAATAGLYYFLAYQRAGASPAATDPVLNADATPMQWDSAAEVPLSSRLAPTVAGRTLDVTATGGAGLDWANVENPTTTVNLSGTTISAAAGGGPIAIDQDYPTAGNLRYQTVGGQGIGGALVRAYLASEWAANPSAATIRGQAYTLDTGLWTNVIGLDAGSYRIVFTAEGYETVVVTVTVA